MTKKHKIIYPGELLGLNEIIKLSKSSPFAYSKAKKEATNTIALLSKKMPTMGKIRLKITYYCKNKKKDKDNIAVGIKFILDGLVEAGKIRNDGWKQIDSWENKFEVDKENPRVEIEIEEME